MPPGWKKAVNSKTLMDSFAAVDKVLIKEKKISEFKKCDPCCDNFAKSEERSIKMTEILTEVVENLDCREYNQQQMANILIGLKYYLETGDINQELKLVNKQKRRFTSRHGKLAPSFPDSYVSSYKTRL